MLDTNEKSEIIRNIKKNDKIVWAKSSGIVVLDKTKYLRKMFEITDDKSEFSKMGSASDFDDLKKL